MKAEKIIVYLNKNIVIAVYIKTTLFEEIYFTDKEIEGTPTYCKEKLIIKFVGDADIYHFDTKELEQVNLKDFEEQIKEYIESKNIQTEI